MSSGEYAAQLARSGVAQVLVAALAFPPGELDRHSAEALVRTALQAHAWAIREDYANTLREVHAQSGKPLGVHDINELLRVAADERRATTQALSKLAFFMATAPRMEKPEHVN